MEKNPLKAKQDAARSKYTKEQRRRKFDRVKDNLHHALGPTTITGWGDGKSVICEICKQRTYHAIYEDGKWRCVKC